MIGRFTCVTPTREKLLVLNTVCGDGETWVAKRSPEFKSSKDIKTTYALS